MLVSPLLVPAASPARRHRPLRSRPLRVVSRRHTPVDSWAPLLLLSWLGVGAILLALVPSLRGGITLGATLPFWLVIAPIVDLAWLARARLHMTLRHGIRRVAGRRTIASNR